MVQHDLRALMPALANKTYFNNPTRLKQLPQIYSPGKGLRKHEFKL
jgi:hypothetical protein